MRLPKLAILFSLSLLYNAAFLTASSSLADSPKAEVQTALVDSSSSIASDLPKAALAAKAKFTPISKESVAQKKKEVLKAANTLSRYLASGGDEIEQGWKDYLNWDSMQEQLQADSPDIKILNNSLIQYYKNEDGLEQGQFTRLRFVLREYMNLELLSKAKTFKSSYEKRLDLLSEKLNSYPNGYAADDAASISAILGFLEGGKQAPELVRSVRQAYSKPNLYIQASKSLLSAGVNREVTNEGKVEDCIMGTSISGHQTTTGQAFLELVPNKTKAILDIRLRAQAKSDNVGYNGPVTIYSTGVTKIDARKRLTVSAAGLHVSGTKANCQTTATINDIEASRRFIERLAWRKAGKQQGQAEEIASEHAEERVEREFDEESAEMLAEASVSFQDKFRKPLIRKGELPSVLQFSTTKEGLSIMVQQANGSQLAAPTAPQPLEAGNDLAIRLHASLVGNLSQALLGGYTLTDERLIEIFEELGKDIPEELKITEDKDPWSITFARVQPIAVVFSDQTVKISIRGRRFTRGDNVTPNTMEITASYKVAKTPEGSQWTRQGDVSVEYINVKGKQTVQQIAFKTFVRTKFSSLFKEEVVASGFVLPGEWGQFGKMQLQELKSDSGWLTLGWKRAADGVKTAQVK